MYLVLSCYCNYLLQQRYITLLQLDEMKFVMPVLLGLLEIVTVMGLSTVAACLAQSMLNVCIFDVCMCTS